MLSIIKNTICTGIIILVSSYLFSCKKYLDKKPDQRLAIPSSIQDLQSLLDNYLQVNHRDPFAGELSADDYYLTTDDFLGLNEVERNMYTWGKSNLFAPGIDNDWARCYNNVNRANQVLLNIDKIERLPNDGAGWNNAKGHALFLRARSFLFVVSLWSAAYDMASASTDPGIPLRLNPDFNEASTRASVQQSYDQVIADLKQSISLLPDISLHTIRPSKAAAMGTLARTYLWMRNYDSCFKYADLCLQLKSDLKDYNELSALSTFPFSGLQYSNPEDIVNFSITGPPASLNPSRAKIDSGLYQSYDTNDLRREIFFRTNTGVNTGTFAFKGSYAGNSVLYDGIATNEIWLMRAECYARSGNKVAALLDLNTLLIKRWNNTVPYIPITAIDAREALDKILMERRKELVMRGLRWMDIKRLNKEGANITLQRNVNNQGYTLVPNDKKYALPIPDDVISLSGMQQNER